MRLRRESEQTSHHPNISPHISHATRAGKRVAATSTAFLFPSLRYSILAHPWATVPSSHTPAGRTWCPTPSIIPRVNCFSKDDCTLGCSLSGDSVLRRRCENMTIPLPSSVGRKRVRSNYAIKCTKLCGVQNP